MPLLKDKWIVRQTNEPTFGIDDSDASISAQQSISNCLQIPTTPSCSTVYVLYGTTGEYSDKSTWSIGAYLCKDKAVARMDLLNGILIQHKVHWDSSIYVDRNSIDLVLDEMKSHPNGDPNLRIDYTGAKYEIEEIQLLT